VCQIKKQICYTKKFGKENYNVIVLLYTLCLTVFIFVITLPDVTQFCEMLAKHTQGNFALKYLPITNHPWFRMSELYLVKPAKIFIAFHDTHITDEVSATSSAAVTSDKCQTTLTAIHES